MGILASVISALVAVILTLVALLRFYLPAHDAKQHNPLDDQVASILATVSSLDKGIAVHNSEAQSRHEALMRSLDDIKNRIP